MNSPAAACPLSFPLLVAAFLMAAQKPLPRWLIDALATLTALAVTILCGAAVPATASRRRPLCTGSAAGSRATALRSASRS